MIQKKNKRYYSGFSLIELMVAMFIFAMIMGAMVSVSVSIFQSYQKSKAIKAVTENINFALNSIAKDARMGKIENGNGSPGLTATGSLNSYLLIFRNTGTRVCYKIGPTTISVDNLPGVGTDCTVLAYSNSLVDLGSTGMVFDASASGFRSQITDLASPTKVRGWAEINLKVMPADGVAGAGMTNDMINVQTTVSSRDYGIEAP